MLTTEKFPLLSGTPDPRERRALTPVRVVTVIGDVRGAEHLTEPKPVQVAIYPHNNGCWLKNAAEGTHAAVLVDFGIELHGSLNVSVWSKNGKSSGVFEYGNSAVLRIRTGESVSEALTPVGQRGTTNDHATRDFSLPVTGYSSNESPETGFRFAYIELESPDAEVELRAVTATLIFRNLEYIGSFASSDPLLEKIYDTSAYTVQLNMQRYLWDGIKRDRLVWAGDMNTEVNTILAVFGGAACDVVPRSLDFVRDITAPGEAMNSIRAYTLWWMLCHYDWYMATGDYEYLMQQRDYICDMLPKYFRFIDESGAETMGGFFDWPSNGHDAQMHAGRQGLMLCALRSGAQLLRYMSENDLADECEKYADKLLLQKPDADGYKQAAAMLALARPADAGEICENVLLPGGAKGLSTFLGYYTLTAIAEAGRTAEALPIIRDYWGGMLQMGATTFWEDFDVAWMENAHRIDEMPVPGMKDVHGDYGAFCYKNFRHSLCHGWASGPAPFLTKYILGVRPFAPGMKAVRFAPELGDLAWAKGTVPTPRGVITVELEKDAQGRTVGRIDAPDGVEVITR